MGIRIGPAPGTVHEASTDVLVCLSSSSEWYGRAIRKLTGANVNHAFIAYASREWGGWWAVQTDERGVVKVPVENVRCAHLECYEFPALDLKTAMPRVRPFVGEAYDWGGILGFLVKLYAWRAFGRRIVNPLHKQGELFCSEFVTTYLQCVDGMYLDFMRLDASSVAPGGSPRYLGTPSLQWELQEHSEVRQVHAPWQ